LFRARSLGGALQADGQAALGLGPGHVPRSPQLEVTLGHSTPAATDPSGTPRLDLPVSRNCPLAPGIALDDSRTLTGKTFRLAQLEVSLGDSRTVDAGALRPTRLNGSRTGDCPAVDHGR